MSRKLIEIDPMLCPDGNPYDSVELIRKTVELKSDDKVIFKQENVEVPAAWSETAAYVLASKFFRGHLGTPERETSIRHVLNRIVDTISKHGKTMGYFDVKNERRFNAELKVILLGQMAAFNSPVFFNVGAVEKPQGSACFILHVDDDLDSIAQLEMEEIAIFSNGSGAGTNYSYLRGAGEPLSKGGWASGPLSFIKAYIAWAGTIRSGGILRRAAKLVRLDDNHPDIFNGKEDGSDFISFKSAEERKARALWNSGYSSDDAYATVAGQNANFTVGISDALMESVREGKDWILKTVLGGKAVRVFKAADMIKSIARNIYECGDPGVQFDDHINEWWTCPKTGRIRSSNPCSEFLCVDNTACNLASLNLGAFFSLPEGIFHKDEFLHVVRIMVIAQDILVDLCGYPLKKVEENSKSLRPLGLGFCNLGGILMGMGLPYDSDEARCWASIFAALMTGQAYRTSIELASILGPFKEFEPNKKPMLKVIRKHQQHVDQLLAKKGEQQSLIEAAQALWIDVLKEGDRRGFRNCQVTLMAPTGTIGILMDAATTGIEPETYLVRKKKMVDGGEIFTFSPMVPTALEVLNYPPDTRKKIIEAITKTGDVMKSGIKIQDAPVFDTAYPSVDNGRCISASGHLLMMAAVQPFISGGISKTVGQPETVSPEAIEQIIIQGWKLGLKCMTIFRENSKIDSPLRSALSRARRRSASMKDRLPETCTAERHRFEIGQTKGYLITGFYPDKRVGEIFVSLAKEGSTLKGLMDCFATAISIALQHGVPLDELVQKFTHQRFEPMGRTSNPDIMLCSSVVDYIFKYLAKYAERDEDSKEIFVEDGDSGQPCPVCHNIMTRINSVCMECRHCKETKGLCSG